MIIRFLFSLFTLCIIISWKVEEQPKLLMEERCGHFMGMPKYRVVGKILDKEVVQNWILDIPYSK